MWFSVVCSIVCFAIATALFTPPLRGFCAYRAFSFYFLFEGLWAILSFIVGEIWPGSVVMLGVHFIGGLVFGMYILVKLYLAYYKKKVK